jgi:hypothetical protein
MRMLDVPAPPFSHLRRLTDGGGLYEHAEQTRPRVEHGYCVDDVARALVVMCRETETAVGQDELLAQYLDFVLQAQGEDGRFLNRRSADLTWQGELSVEDCWGRGVWALGATVSGFAARALRDRALAGFDAAVTWRSPWSRSMSFAGLGAAEVLSVLPFHPGARALLTQVVREIPRPDAERSWPWPEPRLTYANAVMPEVLIAAGTLLGEPAALEDGLRLLGWLLDHETSDGHLSVTPVGGRGPDDVKDATLDQQPIEVAALADACARAFAATHDPRWAAGVRLAAAWFLGDNDAGVSLYDPISGGGCDGLEPGGRNENQGAESTLALISTLQQLRWLSLRTG